MTKFDTAKFSVGANSKEAQKKFEDNWDQVFGGKTVDDTDDTDDTDVMLDNRVQSAWRRLASAYAELARSRFDDPDEHREYALDLERVLEEYLDALYESDIE